MTSEKSAKIRNNFECQECHYITSDKKDFSKHLATDKHKFRTNTYKILTDTYTIPDKSAYQFWCECGRLYKHRQSLYTHRKKCDFKPDFFEEIFEEKNEDIDYKELFLKVVEQQNTIINELIPKIGNTNNTNTNTINQNLNVNIFLNEKCKDAISLNEFIKNIEISVNDLILSKDKGLVKGISNLFITHLNKLPLIQRPLWCSDKKGKTLYVKEEEWAEDIDNNKTKKAIQDISQKQSCNLNKFICEKPNWMSNETDKTDYIKIVKTVTDNMDSNKTEKIIDTLLDTIHFNEKNVK